MMDPILDGKLTLGMYGGEDVPLGTGILEASRIGPYRGGWSFPLGRALFAGKWSLSGEKGDH